jgi:hypothetical protein
MTCRGDGDGMEFEARTDRVTPPQEPPRAGAVPARQLNHHVRAGRVRYVIIGNGPKRPRHMVAESDLTCGEQCSNWEH